MTPLDAWVARANVARLRLLIANTPSADVEAELQRQLREELEKLRIGRVSAPFEPR